MKVNIATSWQAKLKQEFSKAYFIDLVSFVKNAYQTRHIYPPGVAIFRAFDLCSFETIQLHV